MRTILIIFLAFFISNGITHSQDYSDFNYEYALIEAVRQKTVGNINEAIKLYKRCLEVKPDSDVASYELGSIYAALDQPEISINLLRKAYLLRKDNYWYLLAYSQILNYAEEYEELITVLKDYLRNKPDYRMKLTLADAYNKSGNTKKSLRIYDKISQEYGMSEQVILNKVEIYKSTGKLEQAEKELGKLIHIMPESPEYKIIMAEFLEETGNIQKAVEYYLAAYEIDSTNIYAISNLADYYTGKGIMDKGLYYLNRAFTLDEVTIEKKLSTLIFFLSEEETFINYGKELELIIGTLLNKYNSNFNVKTVAYDYYNRSGNYEKAYEIINLLIAERKDNYLLWQQAVYTASMLEKYDDIIKLGEEALSIFPNKKDLTLFMGIAYFQKEDYERCYKFLSGSFEEGMDINLQIQYLTFLGESSYRIKKVAESFYYFEELLLLQSDNYMVMNNYAYYMALENITLERAEELSKKTIIKFPDNTTYIDTYAWIIFKLGRYSEALEYMELVMKEEVADPDVLFHYAWILCKNHQKERSIRYFNLASEQGYENIIEIEEGLIECK